MKFDVIVNAPMEPRIFPITAVIGGIPCIGFLTWTIIICRLKLLRSIAGMGVGMLHLSMILLRAGSRRFILVILLGCSLRSRVVLP